MLEDRNIAQVSINMVNLEKFHSIVSLKLFALSQTLRSWNPRLRSHRFGSSQGFD